MTSPCVSVFDTTNDFSFKKCQFMSICSNKKLDDRHDNVDIIPNPGKESGQMNRYDFLATTSVGFLLKHKVEKVYLESYAYGASNGLVFQIGENGGILKHHLWKADIEVIDVSPAELKKFATEKGNSNKFRMLEQFITDEGFDLHDFFKLKHLKSIPVPITDIVDAYYLAKFGNYKYQNSIGD